MTKKNPVPGSLWSGYKCNILLIGPSDVLIERDRTWQVILIDENGDIEHDFYLESVINAHFVYDDPRHETVRIA